MSWSLNKIGRPAAVKKALVIDFENAKRNTAHLPEEQKSVELAEQLVNTQIDFAAANGVHVVKVDASGSASKQSNYPGSTQIKVDVQSLYGFVE